MGKSKKKEKKKRKRQRSSSRSETGSDSDGYNVREYKYGAKSSKQLQAIVDNYGYPERKSKYDIDGDDMPETEEYVYDQFGQPIVEKSRQRSTSPNIEEFGGYGSRSRSSKYTDSYLKEKKNTADSKIRTECTMKSQISFTAKPETSKSKEVINLVDDMDDFAMEHKETVHIPDTNVEKYYTTSTSKHSVSTSNAMVAESLAPGIDEDVSYSRSHQQSKSNASGYYSYKDKNSYSSNSNSDKNCENKSETLDYNSADFMVRKLREETQSKPTANAKSNYTYNPSTQVGYNHDRDDSTYGYDNRTSNYSNNGYDKSEYDSRTYNSQRGNIESFEEGELVDHSNYREADISQYQNQLSKQNDLAPPGDDDYSHDDNIAKKEQKSENYYWKGSDQKYEDNDKKKRGPSPKPELDGEPATDAAAAAGSSNQESLSIEETNKLRAKLGLKPLNVDSGSSGKTEEKSYADRSDVHRPATNLAETKSEEKMREKMEAIREKRKINKKLKKVKGLGEEDDPVLDSAAAWVAKSRILENEKKLAEKRAQELDAMDEEFGVSKIMARSILKKGKSQDYTSKNLEGLKVEHKGSNLQQGESVILTLKDKEILDEDDEDVLLNINIRENEKAKENVRNKKKLPGYKAYDEVDEDTGDLKIRTVLDKYDEEIDGKKTDSFRLGSHGTPDLEGENQMDKVRAILKAQQVSLAAAEPQIARDYLTTDELTKFKATKKKKVRKIRKREVLKADDLLKMTDVDSVKDRGSRRARGNRMGEDASVDMDIAPTEPDELDYFVAVNQHTQDIEPLVDVDEAGQELEMALQRSRRVKVKSEEQLGDEDTRIERVAKQVLSKDEVKEEVESVRNKLKKKKASIVLDSTSEFCRTLGEIPTLGQKHTESIEKVEEKTNEDMDMDIEEPSTSGTSIVVNGWEQVELAGETKEDEEEDDDDVLEAEPIPTGLAATLNLANMKGYLKDGKEKVRKFDPLNLPETKAEVDIEKLRDEEKTKYSRGGYERDRDRYDPYVWKEKQNYKPDVKLEYVDTKGRQMNQKEAFRLLSHKFHGKGSGKLKTEKRSKKLQDQKKLQMMSSIDTPLNTSALFKDKQKQSQSAYLVLSGGGKNILSGETLKK